LVHTDNDNNDEYSEGNDDNDSALDHWFNFDPTLNEENLPSKSGLNMIYYG
jgi:hypothetical protein